MNVKYGGSKQKLDLVRRISNLLFEILFLDNNPFIYTFTVAKQCTFQIIEIDLFAWNKWKFHCQDYWISPYVDTVPRIDGRSTPKSEFIEKYETPNRPVIITHLTDGWQAHSLWDEQVSYIYIYIKRIQIIHYNDMHI